MRQSRRPRGACRFLPRSCAPGSPTRGLQPCTRAPGSHLELLRPGPVTLGPRSAPARPGSLLPCRGSLASVKPLCRGLAAARGLLGLWTLRRPRPVVAHLVCCRGVRASSPGRFCSGRACGIWVGGGGRPGPWRWRWDRALSPPRRKWLSQGASAGGGSAGAGCGGALLEEPPPAGAGGLAGSLGGSSGPGCAGASDALRFDRCWP